MNHTKDNNFYLTRFQECVKFLIQRNIIKFINEDNLKSFDDYKKQSAARKAYYLNINSEIISNLTRCNKTHYLNNFLEKSKDIFIYHRHYHKKYKSGKQFSRNSWFELLNESDIKICFDNPSFIHTNNKEILSKESHKSIDKIYLVYSKKLKKNEDNENEDKENEDMTKKEEQAIDKKYAEGKGTYINAETEKKMIRKQEQQKIKREKNRIRKICKQTMVEEQMLIEKLTQENKELKAHIEYLEKLVVKNSDIPVEEEKAEKERIEFEKNNIENCSAEKIHTEIVNAEKLLANWENEMKDFKEESEEIVEEKPVEKPIKKPVEEKPDNKNSDIPSCIEDRFQEFINKKYIGPAEATTLWCGLNEYAAHNPSKFKGNGYLYCDRNTTKNKNGKTPQQIIRDEIIKQMQQQHIEIKDEKLKENFFKTLNDMVA